MQRISTSELLKECNEENCCTVVALSIVMGCSLSIARKWMKEKGHRKDGTGMRESQIEWAFDAMENAKVVDSPYNHQNRITINQFIKKHPEGRYFCCCMGHAFAIVDGVLYDYTDKPKRQITFAKRIYRREDYG